MASSHERSRTCPSLPRGGLGRQMSPARIVEGGGDAERYTPPHNAVREVAMRGTQMRAAVRTAVLVVSLLGAWSAEAATYAARAVSITDGDTLHALYEG